MSWPQLKGGASYSGSSTTTTTIVEPHLPELAHQNTDTPMESILDPFIMSVAHAPHLHALESDSDMETPQLSEALTETENDTPPETPLRPTMILGGADHFHRPGIKEGMVAEIPGNLDMTCAQLTRSPVIPPPAHTAQPLTIASPYPIRPALPSFRSFGVASRADSFDEDGGYDSENEGQAMNRPGLPRTRSYRHTPTSGQGRRGSGTRPGLPHRATSFLVKRPQEHAPSPLSTPTLGSSSVDDNAPFISRRPRHPPPPPMDLTSLALDLRTIDDHDLGNCSSVVEGLDQITNVEELLNYALTPEEEAQFVADLLMDPEDACHPPAPKDRSNEATGLGIGFPTSSDGDTWRVPTVVPMQADNTALSSPTQWLQTPSLLPVQEDDSSMSPLDLTMPIVSPGFSTDLSDLPGWEAFDPADDSLWQELEMGIWNGSSGGLAQLSTFEYVNSGMLLDC